jgi:hypothetical protein
VKRSHNNRGIGPTRYRQDTHALLCCAGRLEQQVALWAVLSGPQRLALVDALLDWTHYADRLDRRGLRQFCLHATARQWRLAQSRRVKGEVHVHICLSCPAACQLCNTLPMHPQC